MPEWFGREILGATVQDWLLTIVVTSSAAGLLALIRRIKSPDGKERAARAKTKLAHQHEEAQQQFRDTLTNMLQHTRVAVVFVVAAYLSLRAFDVHPEWLPIARQVTIVALLLQIAFWAEGLISVWFEKADEHITAGAKSLVRGVMWIVVVLLVIDSFGVDISAAITGLGITGVAVALSTQQLLGNLFAFFSITSDQPFLRGDFIVVDDCMGNVEHIGLRSTRIRSLSGEQIVFSNSVLLDKRIQNFKTLKSRRIVIHIGVVYHTPYQKLAAIPDIIAEVFQTIDRAKLDRAHFSKFAESSLEFEIVYYVLTSDYTQYMDIRQQIHLAIFKKFEEQGIEFAYPTRRLLVENETEVK
jgi:small-conductance mechanosensitive channel